MYVACKVETELQALILHDDLLTHWHRPADPNFQT